MRVVLRLAGGHAVRRGGFDRIEHLPTRRSFGVFVNLLVGSLGLVDFHSKLWRIQVGSLVTWLSESGNMFRARLPVPPQLHLLTQPTLVATSSSPPGSILSLQGLGGGGVGVPQPSPLGSKALVPCPPTYPYALSPGQSGSTVLQLPVTYE